MLYITAYAGRESNQTRPKNLELFMNLSDFCHCRAYFQAFVYPLESGFCKALTPLLNLTTSGMHFEPS